MKRSKKNTVWRSINFSKNSSPAPPVFHIQPRPRHTSSLPAHWWGTSIGICSCFFFLAIFQYSNMEYLEAIKRHACRFSAGLPCLVCSFGLAGSPGRTCQTINWAPISQLSVTWHKFIFVHDGKTPFSSFSIKKRSASATRKHTQLNAVIFNAIIQIQMSRRSAITN